MSEFDELAGARGRIKAFVRRHQGSVESFYDGSQTFNIALGTQRAPDPSRKVRGLTSTFTCLESLVEAADPQSNKQDRHNDLSRLKSFATLALANPEDWSSESSAWIYCRVRSLATIVRYAPEALAEHATNASSLLGDAWDATDHALGGSYGVRERTTPPGDADQEPRYFANAYLTYWTLLVTSQASTLTLPDAQLKIKSASDWLVQNLAEQVAFHAASSPHADPQQLAYSIAGIVLTAGRPELVKNARKYDLIAQGLKALFEQQTVRGDWEQGKPLFNYLKSGNAYCYTYETFGELLAIATDLRVVAREEFAKMLRPYRSHLVRAFDHAEETALPLDHDPSLVGWSSGHQPHRQVPEGWATASVFRFAQRLRVLVGSWTSELAKELLAARPASKNLEDLRKRAASWNTGHGGAGVQLATSWVLPVLARRPEIATSIEDPDEIVIGENDGRSAILYGPPGTGKTSMVDAVAGALDWPFIEVTPAHFLDEGLDRVSARADEIFRQMMELDRCVVLLDEIDELVQNRTPSAEALERFFTTTMLPRIAKLWEMGKIMFFANTNNVLDIDSAIRRSQRFDAAILVLPPGLQSKILKFEIAGLPLSEKIPLEVGEMLRGTANPDQSIANLVWFPLARFDQVDALVAATLMGSKGDAPVEPEDLAAAAASTGEALLAQDWSNSIGEDGDDQTIRVLEDLRKLVRAQRRGTNLQVFVRSDLEVVPDGTQVPGTTFWRVEVGGTADLEAWAAGHGLTVDPAGTLTGP